jgi:hypothetical protein
MESRTTNRELCISEVVHRSGSAPASCDLRINIQKCVYHNKSCVTVCEELVR